MLISTQDWNTVINPTNKSCTSFSEKFSELMNLELLKIIKLN